LQRVGKREENLGDFRTVVDIRNRRHDCKAPVEGHLVSETRREEILNETRCFWASEIDGHGGYILTRQPEFSGGGAYDGTLLAKEYLKDTTPASLSESI
jgi:hypothetical protein